MGERAVFLLFGICICICDEEECVCECVCVCVNMCCRDDTDGGKFTQSGLRTVFSFFSEGEKEEGNENQKERTGSNTCLGSFSWVRFPHTHTHTTVPCTHTIPSTVCITIRCVTVSRTETRNRGKRNAYPINPGKLYVSTLFTI